MSKETLKKETEFLHNSLKSTVGRGAQSNNSGRFNRQSSNPDLDQFGYFDPEEEKTLLRTEFLPDSSQSIISENSSPDLGFSYGLNAYRGCEHGCIYCYARPTHEYFNLSAGLDFESKIFVKHQAPVLLRKKLSSNSWEGDLVFLSGVTDCYQPAERKFQLTRKCLEVFLDFRNPIGIITKNQLIRRDLDILKEMAAYNGIIVYISITSLNPDLIRTLEPRTSLPALRLKAMEELAHAGIPVGVNVAPVIPGLTDHELPAILKASADAGARWAGYVPIRLPLSVSPLFEEWLEAQYPEKKSKVITAIKSMRDGKMNDSQFGSRMQGTGPRAQSIADIFELFTKKYKLNTMDAKLSRDSFRKVTDQLTFDF